MATEHNEMGVKGGCFDLTGYTGRRFKTKILLQEGTGHERSGKRLGLW